MEVLTTTEFYTRLEAYKNQLDPTWPDEQWEAKIAAEKRALGERLGLGEGRSVLDISCGAGAQAVALASLGWQVTGADVTPAAIETARTRAKEAGLDVAFQVADMRNLAGIAKQSFDWVISCMALDNLNEDADIRQAVQQMYDALGPAGKCYLRLRDFDHLMQERPRYEFREERKLPYGRVIRLEDWDYESSTHVIQIDVLLSEDTRKEGYRWSTELFAFRRRALYKHELASFLVAAGFQAVNFLPKVSAWQPYEVIASKRS